MTEHKKIFGTDGVRGVANVEPVTAETALKLGRAAAYVFAQMNPRRTPDGARPKIVLGKDTRLSGYMLENALVAGITSLGVDVLVTGRCLRQASLTSRDHCAPMRGSFFRLRTILIRTTASNSSGTTATSWMIRSRRKSKAWFLVARSILSARPPATSVERLESMMRLDVTSSSPRRVFPRECRSRKCASQSMWQTALLTNRRRAFCASWARKSPWPIMSPMESTSMTFVAACILRRSSALSRSVTRMWASVTMAMLIAFFFATKMAKLSMAMKFWQLPRWIFWNPGRLEQNTVVATVMSNFGLDEALAARGGKVVRTKVGDRYVIEEMVRQNLNLGGEQSGHVIFRDFTTTGDGIITALQILRIMHKTGQPLSKLKACLQKYPQAQRNLQVKEKRPLAELSAVMSLVNEAEKELSGKGRVLLRYSGTEPKIRLLIEGREFAMIDKQADRIADAIQSAIGA